jgi:hypothetical protein
MKTFYNDNKKNTIENFDLHDCGYIRKIKLKENDKVIIFGDHHGSFHTFLEICYVYI